MELFPISEEEKMKIHQCYGTNPQRIQEDVELIREWLRKQPHLPQKFQYEGFIEKMLVGNKFSVEATKNTIDQHFTLKAMNLPFYEIVGREELLLPSKNEVVTYVMPKLGLNLERIIVQKIRTPNADVYELDYYIYSILTTLELAMRYNYSNGFRIVCDLQNFTFNHTKKVDLVKVNRMAILLMVRQIVDSVAQLLLMQGFSSRVLSYDLLNCKSYFSVILNAAKVVLKKKMADRFRVHNSLESLYEFIPKEILPAELGGGAGSLDGFEDTLDAVYKKHHNFFKESKNYISNEKLRVGKSPYENSLGIDGTFKKLNVD